MINHVRNENEHQMGFELLKVWVVIIGTVALAELTIVMDSVLALINLVLLDIGVVSWLNDPGSLELFRDQIGIVGVIVGIVYTVVKIVKEIRSWNKKGGKDGE